MFFFHGSMELIFNVNGHVSHMSLHIFTLCSENGIELMWLYPNSTHILQPMDVSAFHPMKSLWLFEVREFRLDNGGRRIFLHEFAPL